MSGLTMKEAQKINAREFIRHPTDIPIEYCFADVSYCASNSINNISEGGLSFRSKSYIKPDCWLHLHIPITDDDFEIDAQVCWCEPRNDSEFDVGVHFTDKSSAFSARMVEQVCHIEQYKQDVLNNEGRTLSGDEAAAEWIEKYAKQFPQNP